MTEVTTEVLELNPNEIMPNPENPRLIFYGEDLTILRESIKKNGVLVPITVFKRPNSLKYTILDGERRWRCCQSLKLSPIPANEIAPPSKRQNILLMFNIHKTREEWELVPTALKLQVLMRLMPPETKERELSKLTGMTMPRVKACIRILRFDKKYLDMTLIEDPSRRIRGEFFSQLEEALERLDKEDYKALGMTRTKIIDVMIKKYQNKEITNLIEEFRNFRKVISSKEKGVSKKHITQNIKSYLTSRTIRDSRTGKIKSKAMSMKEVYEKTSYNIYAEDQIIKNAEKLYEILYKFDIAKVKNPGKVRKSLKKLLDLIDEILEV